MLSYILTLSMIANVLTICYQFSTMAKLYLVMRMLYWIDIALLENKSFYCLCIQPGFLPLTQRPQFTLNNLKECHDFIHEYMTMLQ